MIEIRRAEKADSDAIEGLLHDLELSHPSLSIDNFWVAAEQDDVIGCVHLEDFGNNVYLGSLGVIREKRNQGVASLLIKEAASAFNKDIFIYTVIPGFFEAQSFVPAKAPRDIPARSIYNCNACNLNECICMVLRRG